MNEKEQHTSVLEPELKKKSDGGIAPPKTIRKWDLFRVFLRSFFLQSVWNYRTLISMGFGVCLIPIVKRLYQDPVERRNFLIRHFKFFNAHPYMASYALGAAIHLEEASARGQKDACEKLERLKELLISILGALGDRLFWSTIKPVSLMVGALLLYIAQDTYQQIGALICTFLLYNIPHIYLRYKGLLEGYQYGLSIHQCIHQNRFQKLQKAYFFMGWFAFLLFFAFLIRTLIQQNLMFVLVGGGSALLYWFIYRFSQKFYFSLYLTLGIGILWGIVYQLWLG